MDQNGIVFKGGFRLSAAKFGDSDYASLSYSPGPIAFNPQNNSLFVISHEREQAVAEFAIPEITNSRNPEDYAVGNYVLQDFSVFHGTTRVNTGIENYFRITGLAHLNGRLVVNYMDWYDAGGQEKDTTVVFEDASQLDSSTVTGPYQLEGAAHAAGWLTPVPSEWQSALGGSYIAGHSHGSIISRLSVGPSAFVLNPDSSLLSRSVSSGEIQTQAILDFSLNNMLYDKSIYGESYSDSGPILYNHNRQNDLWTINSGASYGFIVPGTGTYLTIGMSAGHESGLGYKITQNDGNVCGGPCAYDPDDKYNYFWMWRVSDLLKVKNGEMNSYDVRPYQYGKLDSPSNASLIGAAYDAENKRLYVSLLKGDTEEDYSRPPLFYVYDIRAE